MISLCQLEPKTYNWFRSRYEFQFYQKPPNGESGFNLIGDYDAEN